MSIADELREYVDELVKRTDYMAGLTFDLERIAYRIDAEHEKAMSRAGRLLADAEKDRDYNYANWQECKQKVLQDYHATTVEDVLNELCTKAFHSRDPQSHIRYKDVISEYASKLRLAEGEDE